MWDVHLFSILDKNGWRRAHELACRHGLPSGTRIRISHAEIIAGKPKDISSMCALCPECANCTTPSSCLSRAAGSACNVYCNNPGASGGIDDHPLRHEPCFPHQSYVPGCPADAIGPHDTPYGYIGDFNNANQTNEYIIADDEDAIQYTPYFSAAGFRYVQVSGFPSDFALQHPHSQQSK